MLKNVFYYLVAFYVFGFASHAEAQVIAKTPATSVCYQILTGSITALHLWVDEHKWHHEFAIQRSIRQEVSRYFEASKGIKLDSENPHEIVVSNIVRIDSLSPDTLPAWIKGTMSLASTFSVKVLVDDGPDLTVYNYSGKLLTAPGYGTPQIFSEEYGVVNANGDLIGAFCSVSSGDSLYSLSVFDEAGDRVIYSPRKKTDGVRIEGFCRHYLGYDYDCRRSE